MALGAVAATVGAKPIELRHITSPGGFSNTRVSDIHKDRNGFIWIGTSSGLFRYDGYSMETFRGENNQQMSVLNNYVEDIQEDPQGRLWLFVDNEWRVYDPSTGEIIDDIAPLLAKHGIEGTVSTLLVDSEGSIWIAIEGKGIFRMDGEKVRKVAMPDNLKERVTDLVEVPGSIAAITAKGNLAFISHAANKVTATVQSPKWTAGSQQAVHLGYADKSQRLWIFSNEDLSLYDVQGKRWLNDMLPAGKVGVVKNVFQDSKGTIWFARDHHGLEKVVTGPSGFSFEPVEAGGELTKGNTVLCFNEDAGGTFLIGTYKQGLFSYNENIEKFTTDPFADTNCIVKGEGNTMWIGTDDSGVWRWDLNTGAKTRIPDPAVGNQPPAVTALLSAPDGSLYVGSFSRGLRRLKDGVFTDIKTGSGLDDSFVWTMAYDKNGTLWVGTLGNGLYRIDPVTHAATEFRAEKSELASDFVVTSVSGKDGRMYFGTSYGLSVYDPVSGKMTSYLDKETEDSPGAQNINQIYEDSRGLLWLGTRNGLKVVDRQREKVHSIVLHDDMTQLFILGIVEDNSGSMWVTEGSNLINLRVAFDEKSGDLRVSPRVYDSRDGVQDCEFNQRSFAKLPDGEIVLGGMYGLTRFMPSEIQYNSTRPKVMFAGLNMANRRVSVGEKIDGRVVMKKGLNSGEGLEFNHNPKDFTVYFASDNYALPEKTVFQYKLEGYNDEWLSTPQGVNHVTYTNLPPGRYTLLVKAINGDGYESVEPASLPIYVHAPFWATPLAFAIYAILAALLVYVIVMTVHRHERKVFEEKRRKDAMAKQEEINQLKFKFFTNVSHDLRTPLTLIMSPLESMLRETTDEKQAKRLTLMRNNAMKLLGLVNQLLDFRKMEMAGLHLSPSEGDIVAFAKGVCSSFQNMSERKNINLTFYSDRERIMLQFDPDKMEKIFMNLLGNAFKFTPAGGRVDVSVELVGPDQGTLRIKVADTGPGVDDKDKEHIFERFYQVDDHGTAHPGMGSGIGLSMVSEYVRLHEGTVRVTDNVDTGSVFVIEIPVRHIKGENQPEATAPEALSMTIAEAASPEEAKPEKEEKEPKATPSNKPVALVVDDNPDMTDMLKDGLDDEFQVITAGDGEEALERLKECKPDIVVADLMMPRMGGIELTRRLKSSEATSTIPVIILTARHDLGVKVEGLTLGADDYITKPFNLDVVRLRMKKLVELTGRGARRGHIDPEPESIKITPLDEIFIGKAVDYVSKNLDSPELSVEEMSSSLGMSRVRLYKKIKQITGKTPIEFIRVIRLKRAAQMLRESQLNVSEIAYKTGFNNPKVFSKYFKEEFGILPSVYQNKESKETNYSV